MSIRIMSKVWQLDLGNPIRKLVALKLADNASDEGFCWPSLDTIRKQCNCSERSVIRHIEHLEEIGMLRVIRKDGCHNKYQFKTTDTESLVTESQYTTDRESHLPLTESPKPLTESQSNHKEPSKEPSLNHQVDYSSLMLSLDQIDELIRIRKKNKGGSITQRVVGGLAKEFEKARSMGIDNESILTEWEVRGWKSFKADWMNNQGFNNPDRQNQTINRLQDFNFPIGARGLEHGQQE